MGRNPTISAIIPFYGAPAETAPLISALKNQSLMPFEIIVADDASPQPYPRSDDLKVVRARNNRGFGSTVNMGARAASGEYLLILNSDLTIAETFIEDLIQAAETWQPAVVSPRVRENGRAAATARRWPTVRMTFFSWLTPLARLRGGNTWRKLAGHYDPETIPAEGMTVDWVVGACMLVPAQHFKAVKGFDESFHMNSEEVELQRRLTEQGVPSVVVPSVEVDHVSGGSSDPARRRQWLVTGSFIYFDKSGKAGLLMLTLIAATFLNLAWNGLRWLRRVPVRPVSVFRDELALIRTGYRQGKLSAREKLRHA